MTPRQFNEAMITLCGRERGNQSAMAALLSQNRSTIGRYLSGETPIPEVVAIAVRHLVGARQRPIAKLR